MTLLEIDRDLNRKIDENERYIRYSYFELKIQKNLSESEIDEYLKLVRTKLENLNYKVYFTGAKYVYQNEDREVETNEYLIAIKEEI